MSLADRYVPLVEVVRGAYVESVHHGAFVILDGDGSVVGGAGDVDAPMLARSALKLGQATAALELGADDVGDQDQPIPSHLVALMAASHSAEQFHLDGVGELLQRAGLSEQELACTPKWPSNDAMRADLIRRGALSPAAIWADCSGKHAGMLLACIAQQWPHHAYLDPDHPLQKHIRTVLDREMEEPAGEPTVDGCGAPVFASSLVGLARMFGRARTAALGEASRRVASAMVAHPEYVGGTGRPVTRLMRAVPGLLAKEGAEGVLAGSLEDGRAFAIKTADGSMRAWPVLGAALVAAMGVTTPDLEDMLTAPVLGGGRPVGELRALLDRG